VYIVAVTVEEVLVEGCVLSKKSDDDYSLSN